MFEVFFSEAHYWAFADFEERGSISSLKKSRFTLRNL